MKANLKRLCNSNVDYSEKGKNNGDSIKTSDCKGLGGEGMNKQSKEDFRTVKNTLYDTIMVQTYHYTFV